MIFSIFLSVLILASFFLKSYYLTYGLVLVLYAYNILTVRNIFGKIIFSYLFIYLLIPFPNISSYRGEIQFDTLMIYSITYILILLFFNFANQISQRISRTHNSYLYATPFTYIIAIIHIIFSYSLLLYIYMSYGNILLDQSLRFSLNATFSYLIISTIYIVHTYI